MKAIFINARARTVSVVEYDGDYKSIYKIIGCHTFTVIDLDDAGNTLYIDDEGLLSNPRYFFKFRGYDQPLAGNGMILGTDDEGDSVATTLTPEYVQERVSFMELRVAGFDPIPDGTVTDESHPMGPGVAVIGHVPVFAPADDDKES